MQSEAATSGGDGRIRLEPVTPDLLHEVVCRIVAAADPEQIILFGSYAHGTPREYSDLDLFIIKAGAYNRLDVQGQIDSLFWDTSLPLDVLVRTPEQVARGIAGNDSFVRDHVLARGKVLYDRSLPPADEYPFTQAVATEAVRVARALFEAVSAKLERRRASGRL